MKVENIVELRGAVVLLEVSLTKLFEESLGDDSFVFRVRPKVHY